jgi:hypothetical protein
MNRKKFNTRLTEDQFIFVLVVISIPWMWLVSSHFVEIYKYKGDALLVLAAVSLLISLILIYFSFSNRLIFKERKLPPLKRNEEFEKKYREKAENPGEFQLTETEFTGKNGIPIKWSSIHSIVGWRKELLSIDQFNLSIILENGNKIQVSEGQVGFEYLLEEFPNYLDGYMKYWNMLFITNPGGLDSIIIYEKGKDLSSYVQGRIKG